MIPLVYNDDGRMIIQEEYEQIHNNDASVPVDDPVMGLFVPFFENLELNVKLLVILALVNMWKSKKSIIMMDGFIFLI